MKKILFGLLLLGIIFVAGCQGLDLSKVSDGDLGRLSEKAIVCNTPYIRVGIECCLDQNDNKICDKDEGILSTPTKDVTSEESVAEEVQEPSQVQSQNCILSPGLNCKSYKADATGITLLIENPGAKDLTITGVNFTNHAACTLSASQSLTSGSSSTFTIPCTGGLSAGSQFRDDIRVIYDETDGLSSLVNAGTVFFIVGRKTCTDECSVDSCSGFDYTECLMKS